ncbi:hypothetical protein [Streptomyces sp. ODS28]|uniref:hypothetical protein n=1 Tax=Streptomyces sp. ODS28 TaxID=3136688 RepID=UPI0031EC133D
MICPLCTHDMEQLSGDVFECEGDAVLLCLRTSPQGRRLALIVPDEQTARAAKQNSLCPRHDHGHVRRRPAPPVSTHTGWGAPTLLRPR